MREVKYKKNNKMSKGFTLVELIVTIIILGIVSAMTFPLIRKIASDGENKKYTIYKDNVTSSAKLYTDSYNEDMFGHNKSGCAYIPYKKLEEKKLIKDIQVDEMTCDTEETYVKVIKVNNRYSYNTYVGCGKETSPYSKVKIVKRLPATIPEMVEENCEIGKSTISIEASPASSKVPEKQQMTVKVTLKSSTGIDTNSNIHYGWSKSNNYTGVTSWSKLSISIPSKEEQNKTIFENLKEVEASTNVTTPSGLNGDYYLFIKVDRLTDLVGAPYDGNMKMFGSYRLDNIAPNLNDSTIISNNKNYNTLEPKLNLKATDNYTPTGSLKMCISYEKDNCKKTSTDISKYSNYASSEVLSKISNKYDGSKHKVYITIADRAGNYTTKVFNYNVSKTYTLKYNSNGGSSCASQAASINGTWGTLCVPKRTGYTFRSWNTKKDGTGTTITANTMAKSDLTVYAQWSLTTYTISYNLNGGTVSGNPTTYTINTNTFTLKNPTKTGDKFSGWSGTGLKSNTSSVTIKKGSTGNRVYTANWNSTIYVLTFNSDGGTTCSPTSISKKYNATWGTLCTPSRPEYSFEGWYTGKNGSGSKITSSSKATANLTVYAKWAANVKNYKLTYNSDGGSACNPSSISRIQNTAWGTLCTPNKSGYTFGGWYTGKNGGGSHIQNTSKATSNITVYAKWTAQKKNYKLTYNSDGGTVCSPSSVNKQENTAWGTLCTPSKNNYTFGGWYTSKNGGGSKITNTSKATSNITVYAKWNVNKPTCSISISDPKGENGWYKQNVTVKMTTNGVVSKYGLATTANSTNSKKTVSATTEGTKTYYGYVYNSAGSNTCQITVKIDKTPPTCTHSGWSKTWQKANRKISWGCSDETSRCNSSYNGGSETFKTTTKTATIGAYTIKDNAGNTKKCPAKTANVYVDKTAPSYIGATAYCGKCGVSRPEHNWYVKLDVSDNESGLGERVISYRKTSKQPDNFKGATLGADYIADNSSTIWYTIDKVCDRVGNCRSYSKKTINKPC